MSIKLSMCRSVALVAMLSNCAVAAPFETVVHGTCAGDVRIVCNDADGWKFDVKDAAEDCVDEIAIRLEANEDTPPPMFEVSFSLPQIRMNHVWTDGSTDGNRLGPDWRSWQWSDIAHGQPLACLHDGNNRNRLTMACSEALRKVEWRMALREENCVVVGGFRFFTAPEAPLSEYEVRIRLDGRDAFWSDAVQNAAAWIARTANLKPCRTPDAAFDPLYSSWYSFHQDVFAKDIEDECAIAAKMGMKTIILDDGWQTDDTNRGYAFCGDWKVSPRRFPDMAAHVKKVHDLGMKYMVWYSVPFVGRKSGNWERFKGKYLYEWGSQGACILDPRFPEVREFLVDTYVRAMKDWDLDGFKLDFIDSFRFSGKDPAIAEDYAGRDIRSLPDAVNQLMTDIHASLTAIKPDALIEFRQNYTGPAIRQYGNLLRARDCPGDKQLNRQLIANLRLTSEITAVHSDMLEWHPSDTPEDAALPILSAMFATVQYSMMLRNIPESHREVIRHWLEFSQAHRDTLLKGHFRAYHPESQYPLLEAESEAERIIGVYAAGMVVPCGALDRSVYVLNGSGGDSAVLDFADGTAAAEVFDASGKPAGTVQLCRGVQRVAVPRGGYLRIVQPVARSKPSTDRCDGARAVSGRDNIEKWDSNMAVESVVITNGVKWIDGTLLPIEGRAFDDTECYYDRLPANVTTNVNKGVHTMKRHTAGMQFRFTTDSRWIVFRWVPTSGGLAMDHMPSTGVSGIDIYRFDKSTDKWLYVSTGRIKSSKGGSVKLDWTPDVPCLVNLPLYNGIKEFKVGIEPDAAIYPVGPRKSGVAKPVVFYGTSITQGGCASRPGMSFVNIIGRNLDVPVVNLGFSGSGVMEVEMSEHLARIDASCYVLDCVRNMGTATGEKANAAHGYLLGRNVEENYEPFIRNLRARRPNVPIVMVEQGDVYQTQPNAKDRFVRALYEKLVAEGWENLVYLTKDVMFPPDMEGTVDGTHPNDWGMMSLAGAYGEAVKKALGL